MIRLHKHGAVLLAQDEEALAEVDATEAARPYVGPRLSPTVAWIDHRRVEALREALARAGFTPRLTGDAAEPPDSQD